jgi:hypothetical protein
MGLVICPDCENSVSDAAPACTKCGRPRIRDGGAEDWRRKGGMFSKVMGTLGSILLIGAALSGVKACVSHDAHANNAESTTQTPLVMRSDAIASGAIEVGAGRAVYYPLKITSDMLHPVVKGSFSAMGGSGNDIVAAIADGPNYINWVNGHTASVLWQTDGQQTVGDFEVPLRPGTYYLAISNRFSPISDKRVTLDVNLNYQSQENVKR